MNKEENKCLIKDWPEIVSLFVYPAIVTLGIINTKDVGLQCLFASLYLFTPFVPFGVKEMRERIGAKIQFLAKKR